MKVRNPWSSLTWLVAGLGTVVCIGFVVVTSFGTPEANGGRMGPVDAIVPGLIALVVVLICVAFARCWVEVTSTSVIVRNPLRRYVLPIELVDRFAIGSYYFRMRAFPICVAERSDGTRVRCWGLIDADAEAVARAQLLDDRLHRAREAAGLPASPHRDVPVAAPRPVSPASRRIQLVTGAILVAIFVVVGIKRLADTSSAPLPPKPVVAADQATCAAAADVSNQYSGWVDQHQTGDTQKDYAALVGHPPPLGPAIAHLRSANAQTRDAALRHDVDSMLATYDADPAGVSWTDKAVVVLGEC